MSCPYTQLLLKKKVPPASQWEGFLVLNQGYASSLL